MVRQAVRWRGRASSGELPYADPPDIASADPVAGLAEAAVVRSALRRLPLEQRAVLVLRYWDQYSEAEIAEVLRLPRGTVKSRASRGLAALRQVLDLDDVEVLHE